MSIPNSVLMSLIPTPRRCVVERDLYGAALSQALLQQIYGELVIAKQQGAATADLRIHNMDIHVPPMLLVDYGGGILDTYRQALNVLLQQRVWACKHCLMATNPGSASKCENCGREK